MVTIQDQTSIFTLKNQLELDVGFSISNLIFSMQTLYRRDMNVFRWFLFYRKWIALIFKLETNSIANKPLKCLIHLNISNFFFSSSFAVFLLKYLETNCILASIVAPLDSFLGQHEFSNVSTRCLYGNCLIITRY